MGRYVRLLINLATVLPTNNSKPNLQNYNLGPRVLERYLKAKFIQGFSMSEYVINDTTTSGAETIINSSQ